MITAERRHERVPHFADLLAHGVQLGKGRNPTVAVS
jgi:hypothetical protein